MTKPKYSYFFEDAPPAGSEGHKEFFAPKEEKRWKYMSDALVEKYGPEIEKVIDEAWHKILERREDRAIEIFDQMLKEKYGDEANELVEKIKAKLLLEREPKNIMGLGDYVAEKYGPEAIDVIMGGSRKMWTERSKALVDELDITEKDCIGPLRLLSWVHRSMGSVIEATPKKAVREEMWCPMLPLFGPEWCHRVSNSSFRGMADAVDPNIKIRWEKHLGSGDGCCRIIFELPEETE